MTHSTTELRQNERMTANDIDRAGEETGAHWLARMPDWAGDLLAIAFTLVISFLGGPLRPKWGGGPGDGRKPTGGSGAGSIIDVAPYDTIIPIALVLLACALLPLRRRWPLAIFLAVFGLYVTSILLRDPSLGIGFVVILTAYTLGSRTTRKTTLIVAGSATLFLVGLSFTSAKFGVIDVRVFQIAAGLAVAAALADSTRSSRELFVAANERAERAEQARDVEAQRRVAEERLRIAQDLHDTVAHQISVISLNAGVASGALDSSPDQARKALGTIRTSSRDVLSEIGTLLNYLRDDTESATSPPQPDLNDASALIERMREAGLQIKTEMTGDMTRLSGSASRVAYRVVQEGLTNAHKHGTGNRASVHIAVSDDSASIEITNPRSSGQRNQPDLPTSELGLTGLCERAASVGGTVTTSANGNFVLTAKLPLRREKS